MSLFIRHPKPQVQFAGGLFVAFILGFTAITFNNVVVGLTGLGVTAIIGAVLIEVNRVAIWETYRKSYKKSKGVRGIWSEPNTLYYTLNVVVLWPLIAILGVSCIWVALTYNV